MLEDLENDIEALDWVEETIDSLSISEDTAAKIKDLLLEDRKRYRDDVKMKLLCDMKQLTWELQNE